MKASVIIPSYNSRERLYLNLVALNAQNHPQDDVEVIVIDNGSNDGTSEMLETFKLRFPLIKVRINQNKGIANGRNHGIYKATGDILIFHDSDMIASRDFLTKHIEAHNEEKLVACGLFWKRIFSHYYIDFSNEQMQNFYKHQVFKERESKALSNGQALIGEEEVRLGRVDPYSFDLDIPFIRELKATLQKYGPNLKGYHFPWRFFITNNLSVRRQDVLDVGLFDANIIKYGYEDYDLGVRLYKNRLKFQVCLDIVSYHQEHPAHYNPPELIENINYICSKYDNIYFIEMLLICLNELLKINHEFLNLLMEDIESLLPKSEFHELLRLFVDLLQSLRKSYFKREESDTATFFMDVAQKMPVITRLALKVKQNHLGDHFLVMLENLMKMVLNIDLEPLVGYIPKKGW